MAERKPRTPHSIETLLFVNRNGKYCGYKQELISENIGAEWKEFLICAECKGISRKPRQRKGNTVCEMCVPEEHRNIGDIQSIDNIDKRVEDKVAFLNARCPLSGEDCSWEGKLREIEKHMEECLKVRVECQLECGNVLERESLEQHNREICPLRIIQCIYCNQEMQANEENPHIGQCQYNPDTEVPCPYKELGCEVIVLRKNMNTHITENMTDHHTLMLYQLNQLRNRNDQLEIGNEQQRDKNEQQRDRITAIETSATEKEREHTKEGKELAAQKNKARRRWRVWIILALVAVGIGIILAAIIGIGVAASQGINIKVNSEQIDYLRDSDYKYIGARGNVLRGIEWIYDVEKTGTFYGPTFYLRQCKLRLKAVVTNYDGTTKRARYYVERLEGEYDDTIDNCRITYSYASYWYLDATQPADTDSYNSNTDLIVGGSRTIGYTYWRTTNRKVVVRVYFDTVGT